MSFAEIRHQERAVAALEGILAVERVPHAFIFCGPAGVGKSLAAQALAKTLLCDNSVQGKLKRQVRQSNATASRSPRQACGKCPQCRLVDRDNHPDLHWFRKPPERAEFPIAVVTRRDDSPEGPTINESVQLKPMQASCRVTIIEDADLMNDAAGNAFLKTFEEAPLGAYLILLATTLERLLPTIRSRGRLVRFAALPDEFVAELLQRDREVPAGDARLIARFAEGSMESAAALACSNFVALRKEVMKVLPEMDRGKALSLADAIDAWAAEQARNEVQNKQAKTKVAENFLRRLYVKRALALVASLFRDALVMTAGTERSPLLNADAEDLTRRLASRLPPERLGEAVQRFHEYQTYVDGHAHIQLLLENACLELADIIARPHAAAHS